MNFSITSRRLSSPLRSPILYLQRQRWRVSIHVFTSSLSMTRGAVRKLTYMERSVAGWEVRQLRTPVKLTDSCALLHPLYHRKLHVASQHVAGSITHDDVGRSAYATVVLGLDMWMRRFRSMGVATTTASAGTAFIVFARSSTCRTDPAFRPHPTTGEVPQSHVMSFVARLAQQHCTAYVNAVYHVRGVPHHGCK